MRQIEGKRALVTGAASGIGRAIAMRLAREGAHLALLDSNVAELEKLDSQTLGTSSEPVRLVCDLTDQQQILQSARQLMRRWRGIDILVNNAGVAYYGSAHVMTKDEWDRILGVNLWGPVELTRLLLPQLLAQPEAHIVNVSSMYGYLVTNRSTAYHLTKFGLLGFSEALRAEYARSHVGITSLCPGFVNTGLFTSMTGGRGLVRKPPAWICTTAEQVANQTVRAIRRNQRMVVVGWFARMMYALQRLSPGLIDLMYHLQIPEFLKRRPATPARHLLNFRL